MHDSHSVYVLPVRLAVILRVGRGGSPVVRKGFSRGLLLAGDLPRGGVSHGGLHAGRGGPREVCNYLSMATGRSGRPLGNLVGTTWKKKHKTM